MKWLLILLLSTSAFGSELLDTINKERKARGLPTLTERSGLTCAATRHSKDIGTRKVCTHTGKDGSNPAARIKACGYKSMGWGEIVACGQKTPRAAVDSWLKSPGHRAIMLSRNYKYFGGSMYNNYWTVAFSK